MRAAVAVGRSLQARKQARRRDPAVRHGAGHGQRRPDAQNQKLSATFGKAISLAETGNVDEAVGTSRKVIQDADPEEKELHARAYIALGKCYEKGGQTKGALLAYLHVDVLYATVPEAHAEALAHLATAVAGRRTGRAPRRRGKRLRSDTAAASWAQWRVHADRGRLYAWRGGETPSYTARVMPLTDSNCRVSARHQPIASSLFSETFMRKLKECRRIRQS